MKIVPVVILGLLGLVGFSFFKNSMAESGKKTDLISVDLSKKFGANLFIVKSSVGEQLFDDLLLRKATVLYYFKLPLEVRGKKVSWVYKQAIYSCADRVLSNDVTILSGEKMDDILFEITGDDSVEVPIKNSLSRAELDAICALKIPTSKNIIKSKISV